MESPIYLNGPNIVVTIGHGTVYTDVTIDHEAAVDYLRSQGVPDADINSLSIVVSDALIVPSIHPEARYRGSYQPRLDNAYDGPLPSSVAVVYTGPLIEGMDYQKQTSSLPLDEVEVANLSEAHSRKLSRNLGHELAHHAIVNGSLRENEDYRQSEQPTSRVARATAWAARLVGRFLEKAGAPVPKAPTPYEAYQERSEERLCTASEERWEASQLVRVQYRPEYATGSLPHEPQQVAEHDESDHILGMLYTKDELPPLVG